jgi:UDP-N-acetylglucosamine:LPS N-acetylglucosamine transferase
VGLKPDGDEAIVPGRTSERGVTTVDFVFFDAGGGHRAAATALKGVIEQTGQPWSKPWRIRMVNLQEVLDPLDVFRRVTGVRLQDIYNKMLAKGWTLGAAAGLRFMHGVIRAYHRPAVKLLEQHWSQTRPDLVVSLVPNLNRALRESLANTRPSVPFVTILTDLADHPPHFWMEREPHYIICGTDRAVEQARALGHPAERVFRVPGMILRPQFYEPRVVDRVAERRRLGLGAERLTGLVLFGGQGSKAMVEIARRLAGTQLILICGRNEALAARLRELPAGAPRVVEGFTSEIPYYMQLADFFIGKPGPGSISEAVAMGLPVIVERNAWTLPQERYNAEWVAEQGVGLVLGSFRQIGTAVARLEAGLEGFRAAAAKIENRAVFEIPEILDGILRAGPAGRA